MAVSYTHLDVYKRQEQAKLAAVEGKAACGCGAGENAADGADLEPMDVEAKEEITFDDFEKRCV